MNSVDSRLRGKDENGIYSNALKPAWVKLSHWQVILPGMMTGQILPGTSPIDAVNYHILLMFLITSATGLGTMLAIELGTWRLFDERQRLRLDRLLDAK